jgi:type I restriction enzyme S subunit
MGRGGRHSRDVVNSSWELRKLGDAYDVRDGTHDSPKYQEDGYPLITSKNLKPSGLNFDKVKYISQADYTKINQRSAVHEGDLLFAMIGTIGNPIVVETEPNFAIKNVALFKVPENQDSYFLKYYLETNFVKKKLSREAKGTTQKFVGLGYLRNFPISLPPLPEQKSIVAILDEAFFGIGRAVANAKKNLANARELFESYLNAVFAQKGEDWAEKRFEDVVQDTLIGLVKNKREQKAGYPYPYVKMHNITKDNRFDGTDVAFVDANEDEIKKYCLMDGDFLFNTRNSHELVGKNYIYKPISKGPVLFNNNIMRVRFKSDTLGSFVACAFRSYVVHDQLESSKSGTTNVSAVYYKSLKNIVLPHAPMEQQKQIVIQLEKLSSETQKLKTIYQKKLTALTELKQSFLQKAFSGELTSAGSINKEAVA